MILAENAALVSVTILGWLLLALSVVGSLYLVAAALVFRRFFRPLQACVPRCEAVSIFKPLCGPEPRLADNLATFLRQDHIGPVQLVCGVASGDDPAIQAVRTLRHRWPDAAIDLVVSPLQHGANGKISNLMNMAGRAAHPFVVLSDSDMVVRPDYLNRLLTVLDDETVGAVSLCYHGRADAGFWSTLGAAGLSYQFLPGAVFGAALGLARPCMGSTIAMRRATLERIGGFTKFGNVLADDHAIGEEVTRLGLRVAVPPVLIAHACTERSFSDLWRHEVRWGATVRSLVPAAYAGSVISMPLPLAAVGALTSQDWKFAVPVLTLALLSRLLLLRTVDRQVGSPSASHWLLALRDGLSFAVFVASFFARTVDWRGARHDVLPEGRIATSPELLA